MWGPRGIMDSILGFEPSDGGSIPSEGTKMQNIDHKKILGEINIARQKAREEFSLEMKNILDEAKEIISAEDSNKK